MSNNTRTRTLRFNPRSLLQDCLSGIQTPAFFSARNESAYSGSSVNLRGVCQTNRGLNFSQNTLGTTSTIIPLFKHQQLQNVGSGRDYVVQSSQCYWFEASNLALRGFTTYTWNIPYNPISFTGQVQLGDWFTVEDSNAAALAPPNTTFTATFATTATIYQGATVPLTLRRKVLQNPNYTMPLSVWSDPRRVGNIYSVAGMSFVCYLQLQTVPNTDLIKYRWVNTVTYNGVVSWSPVEIWVSYNQRRIEAFKTTGDTVLVDPGPPLVTRLEPARYTRIGSSIGEINS